MTTSNSLLEKELVASRVLLRDSQSDNDNLKASVAILKKELMEIKADSEARNTEEMERNLSNELCLRQKMELDYQSCTRLFEEEKLALTLRCDELVRTLDAADSDRQRFVALKSILFK